MALLEVMVKDVRRASMHAVRGIRLCWVPLDTIAGHLQWRVVTSHHNKFYFCAAVLLDAHLVFDVILEIRLH